MTGQRTSPKVILGTSTFGLKTTAAETSSVRIRGIENIKPFLDTFHKYGHTELDTARVYCGGDTETALGLMDTSAFKIATKVWPSGPKSHGSELLRKTFLQSLAALKTNKVDIFYLHAPDYTTPFEETIKAVDDLYREGRFERFGLSNFAAWQVTLIYQLCKQNGYVLPSVYQGMYNPIVRDIQPELLPCLKKFNIAFYAYNPMAGGLLSGKHNFSQPEAEVGSRFDIKSTAGRLYRDRYWNKLYFEAITLLTQVTQEHKMTLIEATLRWMSHHSGLNTKDGIVIGVSSIQHLEQNLPYLNKAPLPKEVVEAFDAAWEHVKVACPKYFKDGVATRAISQALQSK
ncbi:hypothetical protein BGZ96_002402 [Linnemannia gamsii]|uniref:NADP-dependent oxidoreductase domain-containing protein n=1 Tax=Linnemannia gamsii TaxID=64522 RepID=A0ABQ7JKS7_9FUNG|nr:hypothetical protein BGZ96_002402 [Linnemannia gamsii]